MRDLGVMFSAPMIRAMIDGRKTQTRRLWSSVIGILEPGDLIWVRETFATEPPTGWRYYATDAVHELRKKRPAIHMPRCASRLTLVVREVRAEPLQDISEADCIAEGAKVRGWASFGAGFNSLDGVMVHTDRPAVYATPRAWYRELWDSLRPKEGERWQDNPEVVTVTFAVVKRNIDQIDRSKL